MGNLELTETMVSKAENKQALPEGWREVPLGKICKIVRGGSPRPIQNFITTNADGLNWLRIGDIQPNQRYVFGTKEKIIPEGLRKSVLVKPGDFILSNSMSYGRPYIMKTKSCIHDGWLALMQIDKVVCKEYLYYFLLGNQIQNKFRSISAGSGVRNLKKESVSLVEIKFPPLPQQKTIASLLEKWDTAIEKTEALIAAKEKQFQWLLKTLISDQQANPSWKTVALEDVCNIRKGIQLNKIHMIKFGKYPVLNGGMGASGYTDKWNTPANTVTISEGGNSCGYVNFNTQNFWASGHCYTLLDLKDDLNPRFLYHQLKGREHQIMKLRVGSGLPNIQKGDIQKFPFFLPSPSSQKQVSYTLNTYTSEINLLNKLLEQYRTQKRGLMQKLLAGEWRVNVGDHQTNENIQA